MLHYRFPYIIFCPFHRRTVSNNVPLIFNSGTYYVRRARHMHVFSLNPFRTFIHVHSFRSISFFNFLTCFHGARLLAYLFADILQLRNGYQNNDSSYLFFKDRS